MNIYALRKQYKNNVLCKFIHDNKDLAIQGSSEWLSSRKLYIGGSEMSVISGDNIYSKIDNLVAQKTDLITFTGNIATYWGKLFEGATTQLTEIIFNIQHGIKETGSLPGAVPNQRYSPDGLAVIDLVCDSAPNYDTDLSTNSATDLTTDSAAESSSESGSDSKLILNPFIILFEFKSPFYTIPDGKIPKHYLPQIKTGLCSIGIADYCIFINNMFRKCRWNQLDHTISYDSKYHNKDEKKLFVPTNPLAMGIIFFYQTEEQYHNFCKEYNIRAEYKDSLDSLDSNKDNNQKTNDKSVIHDIYGRQVLHSTTAENNTESIFRNIFNYNRENELCNTIDQIQNKYLEPMDLGASEYYTFDKFIKLYNDGFLSVEYSTPHIFPEYNKNKILSCQKLEPGKYDYCDFIDNCSSIIQSKTIHHRNIVGYLPWKLFKSDIIMEEREPQYVHNLQKKIDETIEIITNINNQFDIYDKSEIFRRIYPNSSIIRHLPSNDYKSFCM